MQEQHDDGIEKNDDEEKKELLAGKLPQNQANGRRLVAPFGRDHALMMLLLLRDGKADTEYPGSVQIGEIRESAKPLRCAYCHAAVGAESFVCDGCGTRLHAECVGNLKTCPTLGCTTALKAGEPPLFCFRSILGAVFLTGAVACICVPFQADPEKWVVAAISTVILGAFGIPLIVPALRLLMAGQVLRVVSVLVTGVTIALALPLVSMAMDSYLGGVEKLQLGWFSYTMMNGWSQSDQRFATVIACPSTHTLLLAVVWLRFTSWLLARRSTARAQVQVEKGA